MHNKDGTDTFFINLADIAALSAKCIVKQVKF
jgi:hypothetical protein